MAVVMPSEMDFTNKNFSMIISGSPGVGKTTLALSAPDPILIDVDRGISRVKACHRKPAIIADKYEDILHDIQTEPLVKQAKTLIIDTGGAFVTMLQDWAMRSNPQNRQKNGAISLKGFGAVKSEFTRFTDMLQYTMDKNIIYVFHTVEQKEGDIIKQRLMCDGAARNIVWQPCDLGCFVQMIDDRRYMGFTPTEQYFAKGCYGINGLLEIPTLSGSKPNDIITRLFASARQSIIDEAEANEACNAVLEIVKEILKEVSDIDSANAALESIEGLEHVSTSKEESWSMLKAKAKELNLKYDKVAKKFVQK